MYTSNKTLLQILVEELPKRGGWPEGTSRISQGAVTGNIYADGNRVLFRHNVNGGDDCVTRDQYEAALAASKKLRPYQASTGHYEADTGAGKTVSSADVDGWIDWHGGECPVEESSLVEVQYRNEKAIHIKGVVEAGQLCWSHDNSNGDIIAYRLHQPQEAVQAKADDEADLNDCIGQTPAPVWNGEGLPPVGVEFEYGSHRSRAKCLAIGLHYVFASKGNPDDEESDYEELLIDAGTEYYPVDEDRAAIRNVIKDTGIMSSYADKIANALIDAGYRKQ